MFGFGDHEESYNAVYGEQHEGKFSHELLAGAASFGAAKVFEDRQRREGKPVSHAFAKELLAGIAGGEVDKLFETHGLDYLDKEKAKHEARRMATEGYDQHYGQQEEWHPDSQPPFEYNNERYNHNRGYEGGREERFDDRREERFDDRREERFDDRREERYDDRREYGGREERYEEQRYDRY